MNLTQERMVVWVTSAQRVETDATCARKSGASTGNNGLTGFNRWKSVGPCQKYEVSYLEAAEAFDVVRGKLIQDSSGCSFYVIHASNGTRNTTRYWGLLQKLPKYSRIYPGLDFPLTLERGTHGTGTT